jgi:hypothetical protein
MRTRRNRRSRRSKTKRNWRHNGGKKSKKWTTALSAAQSTLSKTGDIKKAKKVLQVQALANARKLFGSVGS